MIKGVNPVYPLLSFFIVCLFFTQTIAQEQAATTAKDTVHTTELDKIIAAAVANYPKNSSFQKKLSQAKENVKQARSSWMQNLNMYTSFNSMSNAQSQGLTFVPNLGLGVAVNVGSIYSLKSRVKVAKDGESIAENDLAEQMLYIRTEVTRRYNDYKLSQQLYMFQSMASEEMRMTMLIVKKKFQQGETSLEEYNKAFASYAVAQQQAYTSEFSCKTNLALLEELTVVPLKDILAP